MKVNNPIMKNKHIYPQNCRTIELSLFLEIKNIHSKILFLKYQKNFPKISKNVFQMKSFCKRQGDYEQTGLSFVD